MHRYRFFGRPALSGETEAPEGSWILDQEEGQHLVKTLRLKTGDPIEATDGQGTWCLGVVGEIQKHRVIVLSQAVHATAAPATGLHLLIGALRPGVLDEILPGLTELGINKITVFLQESSPNWAANEQALERWNRILRQSIKQCKRAYLPILRVARSLELALNPSPAPQASGVSVGFVLSEHAQHSLLKTALADSVADNRHKEVFLVCGSEKGLDVEEHTMLLNQSIQPVSLGSGILRAKTAAVVATGILAAVYQHEL